MLLADQLDLAGPPSITSLASPMGHISGAAGTQTLNKGICKPLPHLPNRLESNPFDMTPPRRVVPG